MIARLLAVLLLADPLRFALGFCLGIVAVGLIGVLLFFFVRTHAYAVVLNEWIRRDHRLREVPGLWVRVVGGVLRLEGPQGNTAHSANREGVAEIMTIMDRIATARANQGGTDGQR